MKNIMVVGGSLMLIVLYFYLLINPVSAAIPLVYTNENFWESEHDTPVSFTQDLQGNFYGFTATGKSFQQVIIENTLGIRLQRFSIDEAFFYVSDKGIINASNDIMALSIYLSKES
jgi:hypothetical protein